MRKLAIISLIYASLLVTTAASAKLSWFKSQPRAKEETAQAKNIPTTAPQVPAPPVNLLPGPVPVPPLSAPLAASAPVSKLADASELVIADFDTGDKPNNLGGDFGAWNKDPDDSTQRCNVSFEPDDALKDPAGYALKMDYDVDSPNPAYNGVWMKLNGQNASDYKAISFYARGEGLNNYTKRIKLELKDSAMNSSPYIVSGITETWQKIEVPFDRFKKVKDWSSLGEFVIVFDDRNSNPKQGTILIDQITFEKK